MSNAKKCAMCQEKVGKYSCLVCDGPMYCSEDCQRMHWGAHEPKCNVLYAVDAKMHPLMPYDVTDANGRPLSVKAMYSFIDGSHRQHSEIIRSKTFELDAAEIEARRWSLFGRGPSKEYAPRGTPALQSPGMLGGFGVGRSKNIGPNEGVGAGRRPTQAELDGGNGNVKVTIEFWRDYASKNKGREHDGKWEAVAVLSDDNVIYQANSDERVRALANLRVDRERDGLVVWFDIDALDQKKIDLPVKGGYIQMTIKTSWNNREMSTNMVYGRGMRYLHTFGVGFGARRMLQAKGLDSKKDRVLYAHDKRVGSDVRVSLVVRTDRRGRIMRLVDMEVFIPDLKGVSTEDTPLDSDSQMAIQDAITCALDDQDAMEGLVSALKEEKAMLAAVRGELARLDVPLTDEEHTLLGTHSERDILAVDSWLDTLEPHAVRLQREGPDFVGAKFGEDYTSLYQAINQAVSYLTIDASRWNKFRERFRKGKKKLVSKATQRQYEAKIRNEGPRWALDKLDDADWQQNPKKLRNLKKALERVRRTTKFKDSDKKRLARAYELTKKYLATQDSAGIEGADAGDMGMDSPY